MPVDYKEYHPKWSLISRLIRFKRADNKCEWCGVVNHSYVDKDTRETCLPDEGNTTYIVLTVAHIDRDKSNNRFDNLAALCQKCHLNHDKDQHAQNRKYGRNWKRDQYKLEL
jgi:hypothetical protein